MKGLPVGGRPPVHYLPGAPKTARLDLPDKSLESVAAPIAFGAVFLILGIWMLATGR